MIFTFTTTLILGVVGFLVMLGCALTIEHNVRKLGKAGMESLTGSMRGGALKNALGNAGSRWRERFGREDPPALSGSERALGYTAIQAARLSGCSTAQVDAWRRIGLVVPDAEDPAGPYSFRDLVALRMVARCSRRVCRWRVCAAPSPS